MPLRIVQSKHNARLKELRKALAQPGRNGLAGIEGPNLLEEALRADLRVTAIFVTEDTQGVLEDLPVDAATEVLVLPRELLVSALETEAPQPVAALVEPPQWTWEHLLDGQGGPALIMVLAGLQDPGNLGTILRSAEAFGADGVVCLPGTVQAWNGKVLRASAGSVFRLPVVVSSAEECFLKLREARVKVWTTSLCGGTAPAGVDLAEAVALVIGNEGSGVPLEVNAEAGGALMIPCPGPVESLNAAVAASVLLYEASRQRLERAAERQGSV